MSEMQITTAIIGAVMIAGITAIAGYSAYVEESYRKPDRTRWRDYSQREEREEREESEESDDDYKSIENDSDEEYERDRNSDSSNEYEENDTFEPEPINWSRAHAIARNYEKSKRRPNTGIRGGKTRRKK
jgi:FtsZ-interacting cell division protein ZipA